MATVRLDQKKRALVRSIPSSYTKALARFFGSGPTDVDLARCQQQHYIDTLEANGVSVHRLDSDELKKGTKHTAITFTTTDASLANLNCSSSEDLFLVKGR